MCIYIYMYIQTYIHAYRQTCMIPPKKIGVVQKPPAQNFASRIL